MGCVMFDGLGLGVAKFKDRLTVDPFIKRLAPVAAVLRAEFNEVVLELTVMLFCWVIAYGDPIGL